MSEQHRARIRAILGPREPAPEPATPAPAVPGDTFEERQRARRASGQHFQAAVLDRCEAQDPALRERGEAILAYEEPRPRSSPEAVAMLRTAFVALRLLNARREIALAGAYLEDNPGDTATQHRIAELLAYVAQVERRHPQAARLSVAGWRREGALDRHERTPR